MLYYNGVVYQENSHHDWWLWAGGWHECIRRLNRGDSLKPKFLHQSIL